MATKSEQVRAEEQRKGAARGRGSPRAARGKPGVSPRDRSRAKKRVAKRATYALETGAGKRPSRRSTRASANRAKPDASFNLTEQLERCSPEARFRRSRARRAPHSLRTR
jgi:hypothetical protein